MKDIVDEGELGSGAFGKCRLATFENSDTKEKKKFCTKEVWPKSMETSAP